MTTKFFDISDKDILCPTIQHINGMFFRVNPVHGEVEKGSKNQHSRIPSIQDDVADITDDFTPDETEVLHQRTKKGPDGAFHLLLDKENLPLPLYAMVIGRGGQAKKALEEATEARILFPEKREQERGKPVEIISYDDVQLVLCRRRLLASFHNARMKNPFTHFVSYPVFGDAVRQRFQQFREQVIQKCGGARGFSEDLFQNPKKLHITVGTLVLYNPKEYDAVAENLNTSIGEFFSKTSTSLPLTFRLRGLEIMNDDPTNVDVLYGKIDDPSGILQKLSDKLYRHLVRTSPRFLLDQFEHRDGVKLHVTLMNSRFRQGEEVGEDEVNPKRRAFDASEVLRSFGGFEFGECRLQEVHVSQRYSTGEDGFYRPTRLVKVDAEFVERVRREEGDGGGECYGDEPGCDYEADQFEGEM